MHGHDSPTCRSGWDRLGICISSVCLVHCCLTPIVYVLPILGFLASGDAWTHPLLAIVLVPTAAMAWRASPGDSARRVLLAGGTLFVLAGPLLGSGPWGHRWGEPAVTLVGSVLLILGHGSRALRGPGHGH